MPKADAAATLDAIAAELYALAPSEFTAARNARASASDDRELARQIKALRKPVVAAWVVNAFVRGGGLDEALELSAALREAQSDLDAAELSRLGGQRRRLVAALAAQAVAAAEDSGVSVSAAARADVEKTINAAVVDAAAGAAVLTARLVSALGAGAYDPADLADAVGGSLPGVSLPPPRDDLAERRARKAAEKAAREAERVAGEAERALARIQTRRDRAQERVDHLRERIGDLERDLAQLRELAADAEDDLDGLDDELADAASRVRSAVDAAQRARSAVDAAPERR